MSNLYNLQDLPIWSFPKNVTNVNKHIDRLNKTNKKIYGKRKINTNLNNIFHKQDDTSQNPQNRFDHNYR